MISLPVTIGADRELTIGDRRVFFKTITDAEGHPILFVHHHFSAGMQADIQKMTIDAINNYLRKHITTKATTESRDAFGKTSNLKLNKYRKLAYEYYQLYGPMTDDRLHDRFVEGNVDITPSRVQHLRLELQRMHLVEWKSNMTAKTKAGCNAKVYGAKYKSAAAHD
jgi:transcriptional regulator of heat shock response